MPAPANLDTVLGKAVAILRAFRSDDLVVPLVELVRRTELHKATVHRLAGELVENRLLDRVEGGYRLSGGLFELGMRASAERSLLEMAMPFLQDLYERSHETVHLGVRDGHDVVYIAKIGGHRQAISPSRAGGRNPCYSTAIGKVLLAHSSREIIQEALSLPMVRRTPHTIVAPGLLRAQLDRAVEIGVAFEREESALGIVCVAAPVFGPNDDVVAAISVTGPTGRFIPESQVAAVRAAAEGLRSTIARRDRLR
ncbi:MAG: IclR family transcriptional regulator [Comamonadaceae bacterium]|nr:MAG: IclR family transcriptional regulator [Comamonadaceae bacterium]